MNTKGNPQPLMNDNDIQYLIFTDLDGTLLDHDTYSFAAAMPSLDALEQAHIPVIINSSKTAAEIDTLRVQLGIPHPYIVENGSAIFIPHENNSTLDEIILGQAREKVLHIIETISQQYHFNFIQYAQCSTEDIAKLTGLTIKEAAQSAQRKYTEPLQWQDSEKNKKLFIELITQQDLQVLQGGRFLHVMGKTNKGKANQALTKHYQTLYTNPIKTIALGDSHNDVAMLQAADIAIVIRSPHYDPPAFEHPHKIISKAYGPAGWHECIQQLIFT